MPAPAILSCSARLFRALSEDKVSGSIGDARRLDGFVPEAVLSAVLVRLARLSPQAAALARATAVLQNRSLHEIGTLAGLAPREAERAADELVAGGFLTPEPVAFVHPLVRDAIYRDQARFARARAHREAAAIISAAGAPVESVAAHLRLSRPEGDPWVVSVLSEAAGRAMQSGDPATATALLERALQEPPGSSARPCWWRWHTPARWAVCLTRSRRCRRHFELVEDPLRRAEALHNLGILLLARHDLPGATTCAEQGLAQAPVPSPLHDGLEGVLLASAVLVPELHGRVAARIGELRRAALTGDDPADPIALAVLALHMIDKGDDLAVIRQLVARAVRASKDQPLARVATINHLGSALVFTDDLTAAERELSDVIEHATGAGHSLTAGFARVWRAHARLRCGWLEGALADASEALQLRHFGWQFHLGPCLAAIIEARLERDDLAGARVALALAQQSTDAPRQPLLLKARARLAIRSGEPSSAVADIQTAHKFLSDTHDLDHPVILPWRSELAQALARLGRSEEAARLAIEEADLARRLGFPRAEGIALSTAGTIARREDGVALIERAAGLLAQTPARLEHTRALVELGATLRRTRQRASAREPLRRALQQASELGHAGLVQRARDELAGTGARPRRNASDGLHSLTPTELRIAQLATEGRTNREIAETLVVTAKTIEWHLSRIYQKLGVTGRADLRARLPALADASKSEPDDAPWLAWDEEARSA